MQTGLTELAFILDKSGSMGGLESDTIGGFNDMLQKQKGLPGPCRITTVLFDNDYELLHDRIDIAAVSPITAEEYYVGGSTALLDAIGRTIHKIGNAQKHTAPAYRADKVMFVIITDGEENASRECTPGRIKQMIEGQKFRYGWEFIFVGANIDAVVTAGQFGITPDRTQYFHADAEGVELNFRVMSDTVARFLGAMPDDWNAEIREDYEGRGVGEGMGGPESRGAGQQSSSRNLLAPCSTRSTKNACRKRWRMSLNDESARRGREIRRIVRRLIQSIRGQDRVHVAYPPKCVLKIALSRKESESR